MKDEEFVFRQDVKEKAFTARSARNKRTHNGKGGAVKFPSDYMTKKELKAMNGEVKSYRLNEPMKWAEFKVMPDDIKVNYIKLLRERFHCFDSAIAEMMGIHKGTFSQEIKRLGIGYGTKHGGYRTWNEKEAFYAWAHGVPVAATVEETTESVESSFVEDAEKGLASLEEICDPVPIPVPEIKTLPVLEEKPKAVRRVFCHCSSGSMIFEGKVEDVLNSVSVLLGGGKCAYQYHMGCTA